jgi:lipopolysaccharide/colanic/teichoic acid biosynthesis glycosyltransferase
MRFRDAKSNRSQRLQLDTTTLKNLVIQMIIRNRRKHESLIWRIFRRRDTQLPNSGLVLDPLLFRTELVKEIYRSDRRSSGREFGLIRMIFQLDLDEQPAELVNSIVKGFRSRLRITDSIGWYDASLSFLLPETDKNGTLDVANSLAEIALREDLLVDTEVSIYPWDDELIALADELKVLADSDHRDGPTPPPGGSGSSFDSVGNEARSLAFSADPSRNRPILTSGTSPTKTSPTKTSPSETSGTKSLSLRVAESRHAFVKSYPTPWWKRSIDVLGASCGLLFLSPVFVAAAIAIKLSSPGPVLFRQIREGKDGRQFGILKFRSMFYGAEEQQPDLRVKNEQDGPAFKIENDPRITGVGRYLRKSCVDELPQLINVLMGQMSLVGPRPLPVHESFACAAWQRARLTVLPGLTCTWQLCGRRDVKFSEWMRMDLEYIEKQSLWLDVKLIVRTAVVAVRHKGSV